MHLVENEQNNSNFLQYSYIYIFIFEKCASLYFNWKKQKTYSVQKIP